MRTPLGISGIAALAMMAAVGCSGAPSPSPTPTPPATVMDANAIIAQCPTPAEVAAIDRDLVLTFDSDPTAGRTVCTSAQSSRDLTLLQAQVYRSLNVM